MEFNMKKVKKLATIILMMIAISLLSAKVEATTGKINSETVNLRKEPNTDSTILEQLDKNCEVEILEQENGWYKVKVIDKKITGYVSSKLIDKNEEENVDTSSTTDSVKIEENDESEKKINDNNIQENENAETIETTVPDIEPTTITVETSTDINEDSQYYLEQETEIKAVPLISSRIIAKISGNITVIETINDWCRIENDAEIGWVRINLLKKAVLSDEHQIIEQPENEQQEPVSQEPETPETTVQPNETEKEETKKQEITKLEKTGYVDAEGLVVREQATTSSKELDCLSRNDKVEIIGETDGWYQIKLDGKTGYVSSKYISDTKTVETTSRSGSSIKPENITPMEEQETIQEEKVEENKEENATETTGTEVVEYAKQFLKCKYVSGGMSPTTGFDCSGFTSYVYKNFGISLNRTSGGQIKNGVAVERNNLQLGDIVVFNNNANSAIGHVGIYIGGNNFIHAANSKEGVIITSLSSSYYNKRYVGARRVI